MAEGVNIEGMLGLFCELLWIFHCRLLNIERKKFGTKYSEEVEAIWKSAISRYDGKEQSAEHDTPKGGK